MLKYGCARIIAAFLLAAANVASAQAPAVQPAATAAARSLTTAMHLIDQFKAFFPAVLQELKLSIVQGHPEVERDFDAMVPMLQEAFAPYCDQMAEGMVSVYTTHFTTEELAEIEAFYRRPAGQKMLGKVHTIFQQSLQIGQIVGEKAIEDLHKIVVEELRKKGYRFESRS